MQARAGWLVVGAAVVFGFTVMASEKAPESYVKNMKETNATAKSLKEAIEAKNFDEVAKNAATMKTLFQTTETFWTERKAEDAITAAKEGMTAADALEKAAKAKNESGVTAASKTLTSTCKTCHDAHRERLPDGSSEIK